MNQPHLAGSRLVLDELQSLASPPAPSMGFTEIELVDKRIAAEIFQAVSEREHDVAHGNFPFADEPGTAERRLAQKRQESDPRFRFIKGVAVIGVVLAHHREQRLGVAFGRDSEAGVHSRASRLGYVLDGQGHSHAAAYAKSRDPAPGFALTHLMQQRDR